jgi:hypothetical protein
MSSTNPLQQVESREVIVGGHYIVKNRIGAGSFGEICIGTALFLFAFLLISVTYYGVLLVAVIDKRTGFRYAAKIVRSVVGKLVFDSTLYHLVSPSFAGTC